MLMTRAGFEYKIALDGVEALEILATWRPQVILLDLIMPRKDGFATLEEIKNNPELKDIPVVITSNLGQKGDLERVQRLGASGFLVKSNSSPDEIVSRITALVKGGTPT
jgi:two-component system phosphate regulon response regulator PhoB/two-component system alkaline phosphatase synthesis response regulator PhoP